MGRGQYDDNVEGSARHLPVRQRRGGAAVHVARVRRDKRHDAFSDARVICFGKHTIDIPAENIGVGGVELPGNGGRADGIGRA